MGVRAVGIPLACEHTVWLKPPLPARREELWCVKCQAHVPVGGKHTQTTYFEDWTLKVSARGYLGICNHIGEVPCAYSPKASWDFYSLRNEMEGHYITEHVSGKLADALRNAKEGLIPTGKRLAKDLPPPF